MRYYSPQVRNARECGEKNENAHGGARWGAGTGIFDPAYTADLASRLAASNVLNLLRRGIRADEAKGAILHLHLIRSMLREFTVLCPTRNLPQYQAHCEEAQHASRQCQCHHGRVVADRATALAVDKFTWKPKGMDGFFVRMRHVIRPQGDAPVLFHRASVVSGEEARPLTKAEARKVVLDVWARAGRRNFGVPVEIVNTVSELPADLQTKAVCQGWVAGGSERLFGAYHEGQVYIVASEQRSAKEVQETIYHEAYGHVALEMLRGGELRTKMHGIEPVAYSRRATTASARHQSILACAQRSTS